MTRRFGFIVYQKSGDPLLVSIEASSEYSPHQDHFVLGTVLWDEVIDKLRSLKLDQSDKLDDIRGYLTQGHKGEFHAECTDDRLYEIGFAKRKPEPQVGDCVWYLTGNDREQGKIIELRGGTAATIKILTGPQAGREIPDVPWGIIEPC